jgi:hypothetical protein
MDLDGISHPIEGVSKCFQVTPSKAGWQPSTALHNLKKDNEPKEQQANKKKYGTPIFNLTTQHRYHNYQE